MIRKSGNRLSERSSPSEEKPERNRLNLNRSGARVPASVTIGSSQCQGPMSYVLRLTASGGALAVDSDVTVEVLPPE